MRRPSGVGSSRVCRHTGFPGRASCLLEIYVASVVAMRANRALMLAEVEGSPRHAEVSRLYRREAAMVVKLAEQLRWGPRDDRTKCAR